MKYKICLILVLVVLLLVAGYAIYMVSHSSTSKRSERNEMKNMNKTFREQNKNQNLKTNKYSNRLQYEKSPYLLQHADNPVDWYPWGQEAFEKAREEDKPIFLSIGYSTCHWCHVMEKESFEDPQAAELMNKTFVCIKVDREERPDIDNIYMAACQLMTGSGGWPLTVIMTPDKKPFFIATYIPKTNRYGRMGLMELLPRIERLWRTDRETITNSADKVAVSLRALFTRETNGSLDETTLKTAYHQFFNSFDNTNGGFGTAPKFPTPHNLLFLLRYWYRTGEKNALDMVEQTLLKMRMGGIYDHVGFGFHRYSTDAEWVVPHFEKMLYDQALLGLAYTEAYQVTGNPLLKQTAQEIFTYVLRDMVDTEGGFYSAEDADSEGEEGIFYLWKLADLKKILSSQELELAIDFYQLSEKGNLGSSGTNSNQGLNILHTKETIKEFASRKNISLKNMEQQLEKIRVKLYVSREIRIHPHKDDKILTDWNGLMIAALAKGARILGEKKYINAATNAADFILNTMMDKDGNLFHRYRDGEPAIPGYIDDYAFFILGLLEIYETTFNPRFLEIAVSLNETMYNQFWDDSAGGFYFTRKNSEQVLVRIKEVYDGAIPSGNSVALLDLMKISAYTGDYKLIEKANQLVKFASTSVNRSPMAFTQFLIGLNYVLGPSYEIVVAGDINDEDTWVMVNSISKKFIPNKIIILRPINTGNSNIIKLAPYIKNQTIIDGKPTAYVCKQFVCQLPTTDVSKVMDLLKN